MNLKLNYSKILFRIVQEEFTLNQCYVNVAKWDSKKLG